MTRNIEMASRRIHGIFTGEFCCRVPPPLSICIFDCCPLQCVGNSRVQVIHTVGNEAIKQLVYIAAMHATITGKFHLDDRS